MGQSNSVEAHPNGAILENFSKDQLTKLYKIRCSLLLREVEVKAITSKLNIDSLHQTALTPGDLTQLLGLAHAELPDEHPIYKTVKLLYGSFKVLGTLPFLLDALSNTGELTLEDLIKANVIHSGRYKKIFSNNYDYLKLIFISLAWADVEHSDSSLETKSKPSAEDSVADDAQVVEVSRPLTGEEPPEILARIIKWETFNTINNFDDTDLTKLSLKAYDLLLLITFFLILSSVPRQSHLVMKEAMVKNLERWSEFEASGIAMLRYFNINITTSNLATLTLTYEEFKEGFSCFPDFLRESFEFIFKRGIFSSIDEKELPKEAPKEEPEEASPKKKGGFPKFKESRLINDPSISLIRNIVKSLGSEIEVSNQNLIKLYLGSESGFSIRSLELKIFKWQAPTLFIVSGKRLRNKTISTNKRYEQFNTEYPRFFKLLDSNLMEWQTSNDKITYAVLVNQPWRHSNKKNFGDEETVIMSLLPRVDVHKSVHNPVLNGELIYFNNTGLGVGFGNSQPLNKAGVKKYLPGDVSLTVEMNLEFAVFRHIVGLKTNSATYFKGSSQHQIRTTDFEDRFMITDLEVWGIGSTKELEEQRKQWEWEEKQAEARQSVNLKNLGEERAFLEMVGLVGNHNSSGGSV
ncbi:uncharacterized protein CANTADRAFT_188088 [Suhomyces tanzawaensis NRRL Y-17324]|uniref:TLDc domain-containing protein n=1 Tax=Suhomyces tanzawaensis NRRL Y-17324 TaxID=984487 RepID=A0A1E4SND1_9ASCO|nr:uncharacterized protein CANTADRAFT_188088 [Suhomyces tanzawaensis NRRL Y-17324]ODV80998.1 hypothetical protein CANTADRAFT_188088 [Suhomyces tanzawaensis NRRL Y-17324]